MLQHSLQWGLLVGVVLSLNSPLSGEPKSRVPDLLVVREGWGNVDRDTVRQMLESVAVELCRHFPDRELPPIIVYPQGGPITLYKRGPLDEIVVRLNTGNTFWSQYAYQFAHEMGHILCNYDADNHGNDWFEESLCELASMYALRRMGETWQTEPPFPHWKSYAPHLTSYADDLLKKSELPDNRTLAQWYAIHAKELHGSATKRELNAVVAHALLKHFEAEPEHWEAVTWLNAAEPKAPQTLKDYLLDWQQHSPENHRAFIAKVAREFGITLPEAQEGDAP